MVIPVDLSFACHIILRKDLKDATSKHNVAAISSIIKQVFNMATRERGEEWWVEREEATRIELFG